MATTLELENIGPVTQASIPVPESGGVVVLRGRNGVGKSRTLDAVENLISGRGKPEVRDGALSGSVVGFGVTLKVARSVRRTGELEIHSLDGRLSVADLVDPGLKTPEAADAKRIKALIQVAGVEPSPSLFYALFDGSREEFEKVVSSSAVDADDLVVMADKIKRDCEAAARKAESEADHAAGRARGAKEAAANVDVTQEHDSDVLDAEHHAAIRAMAKIEEQIEAHQIAVDAAELARHRLDKASQDYDGPSLATCQEAEEIAANGVAVANEAVRKLEEALVTARAEAEQARNKQAAAIAARKQAERHEQLISTWRQQIDQAIPERPTDEEIESATKRVESAKEAVNRGTLIRAAIEKHAEAERHASAAIAHQKRATALRNAAKGTDEVLSTVVAKAGTPLAVKAGRLFLETRRGETFFADLSHGERWKIALDVAIQAVGKGGAFTIPQEAWEGLDPIARRAIIDHVTGTEVVAITAECSEHDAVSAEVLL